MDGSINLGDSLKALRRTSGFGLRETARLSGIPKRSLQDWEEGLHTPSGESLDRLLEALDAPPSDRARLLAMSRGNHWKKVISETPVGCPVEMGQILKAMRRRSGKSQSEVANLVGISQPMIVRWESGDSKPDEEKLERLLDAIGASQEERQCLATVVERRCWPSGLEDAVDRAHELTRTPPEVRDVLLLGLQSELGLRAVQDDELALSAMSLVLAARAHNMLMLGRLEEIDSFARQAVRLASSREPNHAAAAIYSLSWTQQRRPTGRANAARTLESWSRRMTKNDLKNWLRSSMALALVRGGSYEAGTEMLLDIVESTQHEDWAWWPYGGYFLEDLAEAYTIAGESGKAAGVLEKMEGLERPALHAKVLISLGEEPSINTVAKIKEAAFNWPARSEVAHIEKSIEQLRMAKKSS